MYIHQRDLRDAHLSRGDVLRDPLQHGHVSALQVHRTQHRHALIGQAFAPVLTVHTPVLLPNSHRGKQRVSMVAALAALLKQAITFFTKCFG